MRKIIIIAGFVITITSGCSSIVSKSDYAVAINSNPDTSSFVVKNRAGMKVESGVTPATITLRSSSGYFKGESYTIEFSKEGYSTKVFTLNSSVDGWYFGNILFGGLIGMLIVDPATGAMFNLPVRVDVSLDSETAHMTQQGLTLATLDSLTEDQKQQLIPLN